MRISAGWCWSFILSLALVGCGITESNDDENVGTVDFEVAVVPTGVKCIYVKASGSSTMTKNFAVTAASSVTLALGRLPLGPVAIEAYAYDAACPSSATAAPTAQPSWVADPISMEVYPGAKVTVPFVFRRYGTGSGTVDFVEPVADIATGGNRTLALMVDGTVREWGGGQGAIPAPVLGLTGVVKVAAGQSHVCAIRSDRTLWCWGYNGSGELGDGTTISRNEPARVLGLTDVVDVSLGRFHSCAVTSDKRVFCWGGNGSLQLGDGTNAAMQTTPVRPVQPVGAGWNATIKVAAGWAHTCALTDLGRVFCWGENQNGELGKGMVSAASQPDSLAAQALSATVDISAGVDSTCALRADGAVLCWGRNGIGEVGNGGYGVVSAPSLVAGLPNAVQVDAGGSQSCALLADGTVRCWGGNFYGELGNGSGENSLVPVGALTQTAIAKVSAGPSYTCAVAKNTAALCWGYNADGRLGDGTTTGRFVPTKVAF